MKLFILGILWVHSACGQHFVSQSVSPYFGNVNPQLPLTYSPFAQPAPQVPAATTYQYTQASPSFATANSYASFVPQTSTFQFPIQQTTNPFSAVDARHPFAPAVAAAISSGGGASTAASSSSSGSGNSIPAEQPYKTAGSSGSSFMKLLLGTMGIHLGAGRPRKGQKGPKGASSSGSSTAASTTTTVLSHGPPGASNPVHVNNHLRAIQGLAQQQHAIVSEQSGTSPTEYIQETPTSAEDVTILHHHYPPSGTGPAIITNSPEPPSNFPSVSAPDAAQAYQSASVNAGLSQYSTIPVTNNGFSSYPTTLNNGAAGASYSLFPATGSSSHYQSPSVQTTATKYTEQQQGSASLYESHYSTEKPHQTTAKVTPAPAHKSRNYNNKKPSSSGLLSIYEQSRASYEQAQKAYEQSQQAYEQPKKTSTSTTVSRPLKVTVSSSPGTPKPIVYASEQKTSESHPDASVSSSNIAPEVHGHGSIGKSHTVVEKPVIHYIEKPVVRFVERTVYKTVEKPVIKYIERPVIRYIEKPVHVESKVVKTAGATVVKSVTPEFASYADGIVSDHHEAVSSGSSENFDNYEIGYGATYVRKDRPSSIKIIPSTTLVEDNASKSPLIHIPKELPAFTPGPHYKAVKTHYYGPTVSGKDIPAYQALAAKVQEAFLV